jgi:hypothetical protein
MPSGSLNAKMPVTMCVSGSSRRKGVTEFFGSVRGALSVYCSSDDGQLTDARFVLARFGEDPDKVVAAFWREHGDGRFAIVPLFAYGSPPRPELCTRSSLREALKTARFEENGTVAMAWKAACEAHNVPNRYLRPS